MSLTDAEIRKILLQEKKAKSRKRRKRRRRLFLLLLILSLFFAIGLYRNRGVLNLPLLSRGVIFIDAGHGGGDPGAQTKTRTEKKDTLALALAVKEELNAKGFKVYLSRTEDVYVDRKQIGKMANEKDAALMVSIHRNKADDETARGVEIWIPSEDDKISHALGDAIMKELTEVGFPERYVRPGTLVDPKSDYHENKFSKMPSCLVEVGFISNRKDNRLFDRKQKANAKAIADGIEKTYAKYYEKDKDEKEN